MCKAKIESILDGIKYFVLTGFTIQEINFLSPSVFARLFPQASDPLEGSRNAFAIL